MVYDDETGIESYGPHGPRHGLYVVVAILSIAVRAPERVEDDKVVLPCRFLQEPVAVSLKGEDGVLHIFSRLIPPADHHPIVQVHLDDVFY